MDMGIPISNTTNRGTTMADKVETLTDLFDLLDLDTSETERLISYLKDSIPVESRFTQGDAVETHNGKGYVHKTRDNTVLVRYPDRFFEEWLGDEAVWHAMEESP
jgi:hypothetical protein